MKIIFALLMTFSISTFATTPPPPQCICEQSFKDFQGHVSTHTLYVYCPHGGSQLECGSHFPSHEVYSVYCKSQISGETRSQNLNVKWSSPVGFSYCHIK